MGFDSEKLKSIFHFSKETLEFKDRSSNELTSMKNHILFISFILPEFLFVDNSIQLGLRNGA